MDKYFVNTLWTSCNLAQMEHYLLLPGCMQRPVAFIITRLTFFFFLYFTNNSLCKELYVNKYGYLHLSFIPLCWVCVPILYLLWVFSCCVVLFRICHCSINNHFKVNWFEESDFESPRKHNQLTLLGRLAFSLTRKIDYY